MTASASSRFCVSDRHDGALYAWRAAGVRDAPLVHVDAHHDMDALEWDVVTISNFVWWAVRDGTVGEVFWVVPDPSWRAEADRRELEKTLGYLARQGGGGAVVRTANESMRTIVGGRPFTACTLAALPPQRASALLDIDVDYFLIPRIVHERPDARTAWPWMWPADLVRALHARGLASALVTIATSTRGGFTPLAWKYFAEEVRARLSAEPAPAFDAMRRAAEAERSGDRPRAEREYRSAIAWMPSMAGAWYRLASFLAAAGRDDTARELFKRTIAIDPGYRCPDSPGRALRDLGDHAGARAAFTRTLSIDPDDSCAALGLAELAAADRRDDEAMALFARALAAPPELVGAHRGLARLLERRGRTMEALRHYDRSIQLELEGADPLAEPIATVRAPGMVGDDHWRTHARLAWLLSRARSAQAMASCRLALSGAPHRSDLYLLLAREYLRRGSFSGALAQIGRAVGAAPRALRARTARPLRPALFRSEAR